ASKFAEASGCKGHTPGRIELAVLSEALKPRTVEIEDVDESVALSGYIIMPFRILHCISHDQLAPDFNDVERGIEVRQGWISKCTRRMWYKAKLAVIHFHLTRAEIRDVNHGCSIRVVGKNRLVSVGDGKPLVDRSGRVGGVCEIVTRVVNRDDPVC